MNKTTCLVLAFFSFTTCLAQHDSLPGLRFSISAGPSLTIGEFAATHPFGFGIEFSYSNKRFGRMTRRPVQKIGASLHTGIHYLFGKTEIVSGQPYNYSNYSIIDLSPGLIYNPCLSGNVELYAGPVLNLYKGYTEFGYTILLKGGYYFSNNLGLNPVIIWVKLRKADPFLIFTFEGSWNF